MTPGAIREFFVGIKKREGGICHPLYVLPYPPQ